MKIHSPTFIHINTEESTATINADTTVANLPKVLAKPKASPLISVGYNSVVKQYIKINVREIPNLMQKSKKY